MSKRSMNSIAALAAVAGLCTLVAGCGSAAATAPAPTVAPATPASSTAASASTPVVSPTLTVAAVASPAGATRASPVPSAAARGNGVRLVLDSSASQASYHAHEQLVGNTLPSEAVGTSPGVSGSLVFNAEGTILADQSTITVDLTQLTSDESRRDNYIKNNTLATSRYPKATFVASSVQGLSTPLPTSGAATFQLLGDLTIHDVTKPVTWQVSAQFSDTAVTGSATTGVNISDFGMTPPKAGPVLSIEDALNLELAFTAARGV